MEDRHMQGMAGAVVLIILALLPSYAQSPALTVDGEVETTLSLSLEDLRAMGRQRAQVDVQGRRATYEGVPLTEILRRAGITIGRAPLRGKALTSVVFVTGLDGFQAVFALAELDPASNEDRVVVADTRDGSPLSDDEGPLRLVAPGDKYPARWIRQAVRLTVVTVISPGRR
jgi:DMSO/TMAO reductase YedYZ molybdopterin-dependent catalytic subunit